MLSTNIINLKQNLNKLLSIPPEEGPVYKAAYNAYYDISDFNIGTSEDEDIKSILENTAKQCEEKRKEDSDTFAKSFCKTLIENDFMNVIADEIDKHIKSAVININVPVIPPTLVSPTGPVTGSLIISEATGAEITIS